MARTEKADETATIAVVAVRVGYYDHIYRDPRNAVTRSFELRPVLKADGTVLTAEQQFSAKWMKRSGAGRPRKAERPALVAQTKALTDAAPAEAIALPVGAEVI